MAKTRTPIPDALAAEVMFASDRTCCVCRDPNRKTEIHHIDGDPSNNDRSNLAVVCKDDHSEAHTKQAFARNLTPEVIRLYNESWRAVVRARLSPGGDQALKFEYQQQVLLNISLAPHAWKVHYIALYPGHFRDNEYSSAKRHGDIWDMLSEFGSHRYSVDQWKKYVSLFDDAINGVIAQLNGILAAHGNVVPISIKIAILRTNSQLEAERSVYLQLPQIISMIGGEDSLFAGRFTQTTRPLSSLARLAAEECEALESATQQAR
ncbi:MAG: HNH endonuclease [Planctomycetes bacterium]|nr:HNH endonuclease [Planctomycetota bacterium]